MVIEVLKRIVAIGLAVIVALCICAQIGQPRHKRAMEVETVIYIPHNIYMEYC